MKANSKVTIRDVARLAEVSVSSAGDILAGRTGPKASYSPATRERVLGSARDLNYVPNLAAQRLRSGRSGYVGLILTYKLIDRSFGLMRQTLEEEVHKGKRRLLLSIVSSKSEEREQARIMQAEQVEGLLFGPVYGDISDRAKWCRALSMPVVFFGQPNNSGFDEVGYDISAAAELSVGHLYEMGHRRIGLLRAIDPFITSACSAGIFAGNQWMTDEKIPLNDLSQLVDPVVAFADRWKSSAVKDRPTAVICHDDYMASFALNIFREKGINVPNELSVVGMVNLPESQYYSPPLTTVDLKVVERMRASVSIMFNRVGGKLKAPVSKIFVPELIVRESVKQIS